jgi:hypothetical protein
MSLSEKNQAEYVELGLPWACEIGMQSGFVDQGGDFIPINFVAYHGSKSANEQFNLIEENERLRNLFMGAICKISCI